MTSSERRLQLVQPKVQPGPLEVAPELSGELIEASRPQQLVKDGMVMGVLLTGMLMKSTSEALAHIAKATMDLSDRIERYGEEQ